MKIALIGLQQAGKRTLFSLLTSRTIPESRKPGESVEGVARIYDPRVDNLAKMFNPKKTVYAENLYVLCPDCTQDSGNIDWLNSARKADLICIVIRDFKSDQVYHPLKTIDPERDINIIESELLLADMQIIEKRLVRINKEKKAGQSAEQKLEEGVLHKCMETLEKSVWLSKLELTAQENTSIKSLDLVTRVPSLKIYNVSENDLNKFNGKPNSVSVSCQIEREIMDIKEPAERIEFAKSMGLELTGLERVNNAAYDAMGLMSFYTTGTDECRAWTIRKGSKAPTAGGKIHTDIERGFIRVEVMKYNDLMAAGSEHAVKEQGKLHTFGKDYVIEDGDICHFLFNV